MGPSLLLSGCGSAGSRPVPPTEGAASGDGTAGPRLLPCHSDPRLSQESVKLTAIQPEKEKSADAANQLSRFGSDNSIVRRSASWSCGLT